MASTTHERLLTDTELAAMLGVKPATPAQWRCKKTDGPPWITIGAGRTVRYRLSDVLAYIECRSQKAA